MGDMQPYLLGYIGTLDADQRRPSPEHKTDTFALQEAGGWNSLAMLRRYVEAAKSANEGVNLGED